MASGISRRTVVRLMVMRVTNAAVPNTSVRLATLEPTMLPTPRSRSPPPAAMALTNISGAEVPKPITTAPMTTGDMSSRVARRAEPSTKLSAA